MTFSTASRSPINNIKGRPHQAGPGTAELRSCIYSVEVRAHCDNTTAASEPRTMVPDCHAWLVTTQLPTPLANFWTREIWHQTDKASRMFNLRGLVIRLPSSLFVLGSRDAGHEVFYASPCRFPKLFHGRKVRRGSNIFSREFDDTLVARRRKSSVFGRRAF
jgi:hypothetical protein